MSGILDQVDRRTQLVGRNRLELLLFRLEGPQVYGLNVFKIREVVQRPPLVHLPQSHPYVCGVATLRGSTIPVLDLAASIGQPALGERGRNVIITEYNRSVQGFLVAEVERIVNVNWEQVVPPPEGVGQGTFLTAVAHVEDAMVEIIDVEKILAEVAHMSMEVTEALQREGGQRRDLVLAADDSAMARRQIERVLEQVGMQGVFCSDGRQALELLRRWAEEGAPELERLAMVISDIEMPQMDGYTLTAKLREDERLKHLYVMLHTSLSGVFNDHLVKRAGADEFVAKFSPDELAKAILRRLEALEAEAAGQGEGAAGAGRAAGRA